MKFTSRPVYLTALILLVVPYCFAQQNKDWQAISQTELQMKNPQVEANADAEVLLWEVSIEDKYIQRAEWQSTLHHHLRIKIFTERGREINSKVDIPFGNLYDRDSRVIIKDIAARTIKPDGGIIDVKPGDVFERDIVTGSGVKIKAKSFAMPGLEIGAIIEYRWKEVRTDTFNYSRIELARDIPVQYVKYTIRPVQNVPIGMRLHSFNTASGFVKETDDGFYSTTMRNVPAIKQEPKMPSEYDIKPWVLVFYDTDKENQSAADYWKERGKLVYEEHKDLLKPNGDIKTAAAQAVGSATEPAEKVRRIYDFCRKNIKNVYDDESGLTADKLREVKFNRTPAEALKRGTGSWHDIGMLFGAMLSAAGIDARIANVAVRTDARFDNGMTNDYFIRTEVLAAKIGDKWQFFDFSTFHLPFGMIIWTVEGQNVLISDKDAPFWEKIPVSSAAESNQKSIAKLRLSPEGNLEGEVKIEYTGQLALSRREYDDDISQAEREKHFTETIRAQVGGNAEITTIKTENLEETEKPYIYSFKIRVPAYAERTGKRLFLRPNIFKRNGGALFTAGVRKYDISFDYAWSEEDEISVELPAGYSLESVDSPKPLRNEKFGASQETKIYLSEDKSTLIYGRKFSFGKPDSLSFNKSQYAILKGLFESFRNVDSQSLILREDSPTMD